MNMLAEGQICSSDVNESSAFASTLAVAADKSAPLTLEQVDGCVGYAAISVAGYLNDRYIDPQHGPGCLQ